MGTVPGVIALIACFMIMIIILAVLAMIVVKSLDAQPAGYVHRGLYHSAGVFMRDLSALYSPGKILEASIMGVAGLILQSSSVVA